MHLLFGCTALPYCTHISADRAMGGYQFAALIATTHKGRDSAAYLMHNCDSIKQVHWYRPHRQAARSQHPRIVQPVGGGSGI